MSGNSASPELGKLRIYVAQNGQLKKTVEKNIEAAALFIAVKPLSYQYGARQADNKASARAVVGALQALHIATVLARN